MEKLTFEKYMSRGGKTSECSTCLKMSVREDNRISLTIYDRNSKFLQTGKSYSDIGNHFDKFINARDE